jgi:hypothetical protein
MHIALVHGRDTAAQISDSLQSNSLQHGVNLKNSLADYSTTN